MNCWEFMKCGCEGMGAGGEKCPAYPNDRRKCARVKGTVCGGRQQGAFATKLAKCMKCPFYNSPHYRHG